MKWVALSLPVTPMRKSKTCRVSTITAATPMSPPMRVGTRSRGWSPRPSSDLWLNLCPRQRTLLLRNRQPGQEPWRRFSLDSASTAVRTAIAAPSTGLTPSTAWNRLRLPSVSCDQA